MSLLVQNIRKKRQIDENATQLEFKVNNIEKYKFEDI